MSEIEIFVNIPSNVSGVTSAECMVTNFIIEHNYPVNVSDHLIELIKAICPDFNITSVNGQNQFTLCISYILGEP